MNAVQPLGSESSRTADWARHLVTTPLCWVMEQLGIGITDETSLTPYETRWSLCKGSYVDVGAVQVRRIYPRDVSPNS
jgi:hypothetical protein